jgi:hypothetical protein
MARDLTLGIGFVVFLMWLMFFATPGSIEVATLAVGVALLIWFATVPAERLIDGRSRPSAGVFGLAGLGAAVVIVASTVISTGTVFLLVGITIAAIVTGLTRAIRLGMINPRNGDGIR